MAISIRAVGWTVDLTNIEGTDLITQIKDLYRPSINPKDPTVTYDDKGTAATADDVGVNGDYRIISVGSPVVSKDGKQYQRLLFNFLKMPFEGTQTITFNVGGITKSASLRSFMDLMQTISKFMIICSFTYDSTDANQSNDNH